MWHRSPTMALRSIRLTCGLFDTDGPSESALQPSLVEPELKTSDLSALNAADLFAALETDLPDLDDLELSPQTGEELLGMDTSFLENFTNLDDYSRFFISDKDATLMVAEVPEPTEVAKGEGVNPLKRTAVHAVPEKITLPNPDHDYVSKSKRPRLSNDSESVTNVADEHVKYRERRVKNNIASKRSRETRKEKFTLMELKAIELEAANEELEKKVTELEGLTKRMKEILVQRLAGAK